MPKRANPRYGSMQFWPRKRAKRSYARIRSWPEGKGLLAFPCFKAGMTQINIIDSKKTSMTKGEEIVIPATILEAPPIRIYSVRFYKKDIYGLKVKKEIVLSAGKELLRKVLTKKAKSISELDSINPEEYDEIRVIVYTQPRLTGIGKKKPDLFEAKIGGNIKEGIDFVKTYYNKDIRFSDVFKEGDVLDAHVVSKGKGYQGPVKRFGITLKQHKSEKGRRRPGSLGGWVAQQHTMYRVAYAGQTGYHLRTQNNNLVIKIVQNAQDVNPKGGFIRYGLLKNEAIIVKGSVPGAKKRTVILTKPIHLYKKIELPTFVSVNRSSQQGVRV